MENTNYIIKDIAERFKGYSITKLNDSIEQIINNSDKTNSNFEDIKNYESVKILGWKDIKDYIKNHKIDDKCNSINVSRKYKKNINYMKKGDLVFPVIFSRDNFDVVYIDEEPAEEGKYIYNESVLVVRVTEPNIDSKYIYIMCANNKKIQDNLFKLKDDSKKIISRLTKEMLSALEIPKLTETKRKKIVDEYNKLQIQKDKFDKMIENI